MGCGCKNKSQSSNQQTENKIVEASKQNQTENIKDAIKKTVEKYYNATKGSTNGWIKS